MLAALLCSGADALHGQARLRCDTTVKSRAIQVERTILLAAVTADSNATLPRPLTDDLMEKVAASFRVPTNLALPLYSGPTNLPSDSGEGKREFAHPSLGALIRVTFDQRGVPLRAILYDETFDPRLDSAFAASLGSAFPDSSTSEKRPEMVRDTLVVDFSLTIEPSITAKQRAELNRLTANGRLLQLPIARIALPHFPDALPPRPITKINRARMVQEHEANDIRGAMVEVHAVLDTTGRFGAIWIAQASNPPVANMMLQRVREDRYIPATIGGCPVPVRFVFRTQWSSTGISRPLGEMLPSRRPWPQ